MPVALSPRTGFDSQGAQQRIMLALQFCFEPVDLRRSFSIRPLAVVRPVPIFIGGFHVLPQKIAAIEDGVLE